MQYQLTGDTPLAEHVMVYFCHPIYGITRSQWKVLRKLARSRGLNDIVSWATAYLVLLWPKEMWRNHVCNFVCSAVPADCIAPLIANAYADIVMTTLQGRHNELGGVSNHLRLECLPNGLSRHRFKKTSKTPLAFCGGNSPLTGEFPAQRASNAENVSIWWRHHASQNA